MNEHPAWLAPLANLVAERLGLDFPPQRWADLQRGVQAAALLAGTHDVPAFTRDLLLENGQGPRLQGLAATLTVGETYFYRDRRSFEWLSDEILPALIRQRRDDGSQRLRLWSAGCCTGEEAYSLAIALDRLLPSREGWSITLLATDVNTDFLRTAEAGEYGDWSFRDSPQWLRDAYFAPAGPKRVALAPWIRQMVSFARLNLVDDADPSWLQAQSMDLILCRNVLMYFSPAQVAHVLHRLGDALVEGGWLSLSTTETAIRPETPLEPAHLDGALFYRKGAAAPAEAPPPAPQAQAATPPAAKPPPRPAPRAASSALAQARAHADAGRLVLARRCVEQALAAARLDVDAHHLHAAILEEMGEWQQARAALQRALYLEPEFVLAHHALARVALRQGLRTEALRHLRNALALLDRHDAGALLPGADGLAAGQLKALISALLETQEVA